MPPFSRSEIPFLVATNSVEIEAACNEILDLFFPSSAPATNYPILGIEITFKHTSSSQPILHFIQFRTVTQVYILQV
jgi:hypothetical protein